MYLAYYRRNKFYIFFNFYKINDKDNHNKNILNISR